MRSWGEGRAVGDQSPPTTIMLSLSEEARLSIHKMVLACFQPEVYRELFDEFGNMLTTIEAFERHGLRPLDCTKLPKNLCHLIEDYASTILVITLECYVWYKSRSHFYQPRVDPPPIEHKILQFKITPPFGEAFKLALNCDLGTFEVKAETLWDDPEHANLRQHGVCRQRHCDHTRVLNLYMKSKHGIDFVPARRLRKNGGGQCRRITRSRRYCSDHCKVQLEVLNHEGTKRALEIVKLVFLQVEPLVGIRH